jgi:hypothetical protein
VSVGDEHSRILSSSISQYPSGWLKQELARDSLRLLKNFTFGNTGLYAKKALNKKLFVVTGQIDREVLV